MTDRLVVAFVKGPERYIFLFEGPDDLPELCRALGRLAANPELSFTWLDVSKVLQSARAMLSGAR